MKFEPRSMTSTPADDASPVVGEAPNPVDEASSRVGEAPNPVDEASSCVGEACNPDDEASSSIGEACNPDGDASPVVGDACNPVGDARTAVVRAVPSGVRRSEIAPKGVPGRARAVAGSGRLWDRRLDPERSPGNGLSEDGLAEDGRG